MSECPECGADLETESRDATGVGLEFVGMCRKRGDNKERVLMLAAAYFDFLEADHRERREHQAKQTAVAVSEQESPR